MKAYWITDSRFKIILVTLVLMWLGVMVLFYLKADAVTKNPCQICAKKIGTSVSCSALDPSGRTITFNPDYTTEESSIDDWNNISLNFSGV